MLNIKPHHTHVVIYGEADNPDSGEAVYATDDEANAVDMAAIMMANRPKGSRGFFMVSRLADDSRLP